MARKSTRNRRSSQENQRQHCVELFDDGVGADLFRAGMLPGANGASSGTRDTEPSVITAGDACAYFLFSVCRAIIIEVSGFVFVFSGAVALRVSSGSFFFTAVAASTLLPDPIVTDVAATAAAAAAAASAAAAAAASSSRTAMIQMFEE